MNEIIELNDKLQHAPAGVLVGLFAIVLGYLLKMTPFCPNNLIPIFVVAATTVMFPIVQACTWIEKLLNTNAQPLMWSIIFLHIPANILIGFITGFAAWTFHAQILKRWFDPKIFNDDGSTKFLTKPQPPVNPPAQP